MPKRYFLDQTVYEAALERMRFIYTEFKQVYVAFSGGKDSTVCLNLALEVATAMDRLPVKVLFIDQEAEWQATIDYVRRTMDDPRVSGRWLQVPFRLFNATSLDQPWLDCWAPGKEAEWIRPQEPDAITRNVYGTDRFKELFAAFLTYHHPAGKACRLGGLRAEESPTRALTLTSVDKYKGVTWGAGGGRRQHNLFYPIYDWSFRDVWKYIHDHHFDYCDLYNKMYQYGLPVAAMRVSNVHHETAVQSLFYLQEIEPETWNKVQRRLKGVNAAAHLASHFFPRTLPAMFGSWAEYRDYLLPRLISRPDHIAYFEKLFTRLDAIYSESPFPDRERLHMVEASAIARNDTFGTVLEAYHATHRTNNRRAKEAAAAIERARVAALTAAGLPTTSDDVDGDVP